MIRGLVIGKFLPVHEGHISLIRFAANQCDQLIVSMSYTEDDPIPAELRISWLKKIFSGHDKIEIHSLKDDFDQEHDPWEIRTKIWADVIREKYLAVNVIFSSEEYGEPFATNLGIKHISFDPERRNNPVSATRIRQNPFRYWSYIPPVVRPYFVKKVCLYGPESTGKSVMAKKLAGIFQTEYVPEVARELITSNDFTMNDIIRIGHAQTQRVMEKTETSNKILFCDTDLITTQIYCRHYLGSVPEILFELEKKVFYHQYFLFDVDVPWVPDGMRDLGGSREKMFLLFKNALEERNIPYIRVSGNYAHREQIIESAIRTWFQ